VQYTCKVRLRADGSKDAQTSSGEESEAEMEEAEAESDMAVAQNHNGGQSRGALQGVVFVTELNLRRLHYKRL
jgi:hypothetical protein